MTSHWHEEASALTAEILATLRPTHEAIFAAVASQLPGYTLETFIEESFVETPLRALTQKLESGWRPKSGYRTVKTPAALTQDQLNEAVLRLLDEWRATQKG